MSQSIYNLVRVGRRALPVLVLADPKAERHERELHQVFHRIRFKMTGTRIWLKRLAMALYGALCYYAHQHYQIDETALYGMLGGFSFLFHLEFKIGITANIQNRLECINEDITDSGYTEWFAIPLFFAPVIPLATVWKWKPWVLVVGVAVVVIVAYFLNYKI